MRDLGMRLKNDATLAADAEAALRVGVHWDTQCRPPSTHRVCQVYASALPVAYANARSADWEPFARVVLRAAYEATLAVGVLKAQKMPTGRAKVFLTALGGGAFGNQFEWIRDGLSDALHTHRDSPLDVTLVHYGTHLAREWESLQRPSAGGAAGQTAASCGSAL